MKIAFAFVVGCLMVMAASAGQPKYTTKYDNIDLDSILKSDRLLANYVNCLMERGKCTPDAKELKDNIGDAILNECDGCSQKQRDGADKVIRYLIKNKKAMWTELRDKYDPQRVSTKYFADAVA